MKNEMPLVLTRETTLQVYKFKIIKRHKKEKRKTKSHRFKAEQVHTKLKQCVMHAEMEFLAIAA